MHTLETTIRTGPDGILRVELPTGDPDRAMDVVLVAQPTGQPEPQAHLVKVGIRPPTQWNQREPVRLSLGNPAVSQTLVEDRR